MTIDQLLLNLPTYGLGLYLWVRFFGRESILKSVVYGFCVHIVVSVFIAYITNLLLHSYISSQFVFMVTSLFGAIAIFMTKFSKTKTHSIQNESAIQASIILVLSIAFVLNIVIYSKNGLFLPLIGNNDDTATHLGMSIMTLKENSMLFKNSILESFIERGIDYRNARFYPPTIYGYTALFYGALSPKIAPIDLPLVFGVYAIFAFIAYLIFIYSIFDLAFGLVKSASIWAYTPLLVFGIFFVGGEYFMSLFRMSYLTQLLGNAFLLMFFKNLAFYPRVTNNGRYDLYEDMKLGVLLLGVGITYYLFLPIAIAGLLFGHPYFGRVSNQKVFSISRIIKLLREGWVILAFALLSAIPLLLYSKSHSVLEQITIPGINLLTYGSIIQFCLMALGFIVLRGYFVRKAYNLALVGALASLLLAVATTSPSMILSGNMPYYFFKSFFTTASFATAFGISIIIVSVSHSVAYLHNKSRIFGFVFLALFWVLTPMLFVRYLYSHNTLIPGYKAVTLLSNGSFNFYRPQIFNKLNDLYTRHSEEKIAVYNPGYWGENILLFSLFENIPQIHIDGTNKKIYYFSSDPEYYMKDMIASYKLGQPIYLFDGHGSFKKDNKLRPRSP